jgi:dihydroorotase-like cyclic amidohydrolase
MGTIVLQGGQVVDAGGTRTADVVIDDGRIVGVGPDLTGDRVLDARGCVVAPGLVDLHSHLRQPGQEEAETMVTGARAAALGG